MYLSILLQGTGWHRSLQPWFEGNSLGMGVGSGLGLVKLMDVSGMVAYI